MKVFGIIALTLAVVLLTAEAKNARFGVKGRRDVLLYTKDIIGICEVEEGCTNVVKYPVDGDINEKTITFIYCQDELGEASNVEATLVAGGFGQKTAEIHLKSKKGEPTNFVVEIYGKQFAFFNGK